MRYFVLHTSVDYGGTGETTSEQWRLRAHDLRDAISQVLTVVKARHGTPIDVVHGGRLVWHQEPPLSEEEENVFDEETGLL